jgi:hypothetical protein
MSVKLDDERCDLIAKWIHELKGACEKGDVEACDELGNAKKQYEDELYVVYGGD